MNSQEILNRIEEELQHILIIENVNIQGKYRPIKNTTKNQCYEAIYNIQKILKEEKDYE